MISHVYPHGGQVLALQALELGVAERFNRDLVSYLFEGVL